MNKLLNKITITVKMILHHIRDNLVKHIYFKINLSLVDNCVTFDNAGTAMYRKHRAEQKQKNYFHLA